jgi:hypothetical protein
MTAASENALKKHLPASTTVKPVELWPTPRWEWGGGGRRVLRIELPLSGEVQAAPLSNKRLQEQIKSQL